MDFMVGTITSQCWVQWALTFGTAEASLVPHCAFGQLLFSGKYCAATTWTTLSWCCFNCCCAWITEWSRCRDLLFPVYSNTKQLIKLSNSNEIDWNRLTLTLIHRFEGNQIRKRNRNHVVPNFCHSKFCSKHPCRVHRKQWLSLMFCCSLCIWSICDAIRDLSLEPIRRQTQRHHNVDNLGLVELEFWPCQWHMSLEPTHLKFHQWEIDLYYSINSIWNFRSTDYFKRTEIQISVNFIHSREFLHNSREIHSFIHLSTAASQLYNSKNHFKIATPTQTLRYNHVLTFYKC